MSIHTAVIQPASSSAHPVPARLRLIVPELAADEPAAPAHTDAPAEPSAAPAEPYEPSLVVSRYHARLEHGTCALCWAGPGPLAGSIRRRGTAATEESSRGICSRCLVTLEMLAAQFDRQLRLQIETTA